jgi:hypothetical protein
MITELHEEDVKSERKKIQTIPNEEKRTGRRKMGKKARKVYRASALELGAKNIDFLLCG